MLDTKFLLALACMCAISFPVFSQPFEKLIPIADNLAKNAEVYLFSDENGGLLFIKEENNGIVLKLDNELEVEKTFKVSGFPDKSSHEQLGFTYKDGLLFLAYLNKETEAYEVVSILSDTEGTQYSTIDMSRLSRGSVFWGTFTYKGALHIVRLPKDKATIRLCRFEGGEEFNAEEYQIESEEFANRMRNNLTRIDAEHPPTMDRTYLPGKLYHYEDQLYLTLDEATETHVVHINLRNGNKEEYSLPVVQFKDSLTKSNSLIVEDRVLQLAMCKDSLCLTIRDLNSRLELHKYQYTVNDDWDIQLWHAEQVLADGKIKNFSSHQEFFDQIYGMPYLAIGANMQADSKIEFQLGGVSPLVTKGVTGIIIDQNFELAYLPSFIETQNDHFPQALPRLLVSNRFAGSQLSTKPNYRKLKWNGKSYFGYFDEARGGYYLTR